MAHVIKNDYLDYGKEVCDILGIKGPVRGFELRCYVNEVVTVKIERYVEEDELKKIKKITKEKYHFSVEGIIQEEETTTIK
jgi:hypothetical protein